jgi:multidrug efflux system membrane fusion protein
VPSQAVQIGQDKSFVYVAKADGTVEMRTVKTGTSIESMTVIEEGLQPGEQVVTDGQLRLVPGAKYQAKGQGQGGRGQRGDQGQGGPPAATNPNEGAQPAQGGRRGGQNPNP